MKKTFLRFAIAIAAVTFIGVSCTEDDITSPTITITDGTDVIDLGDTWVDAGATANDDKDGDLTSQITTTGTVNGDAVGVYEVVYTVSDEAGNPTTETRTVTVRANELAGNYNTAYIVTGSFPANFSFNEAASVSTSYNKVVVNNFGGYEDCIVSVTINGTDAVFTQTVSFDWDNDGTATNATFTCNSADIFTITAGVASLTTISYDLDYLDGDVDHYVVGYVRF